MKTLQVNLAPGYSIHIGTGLFTSDLLVDCCRQQANNFVIITDNNLSACGETLQTFLQKNFSKVILLTFPAGEQHKTRATKELLEDKMLAQQFGRDSCVIALGGGVVSDVAGFIAATYMRGVPVIYIPTTLLAMVDASIGGKTGIDTPYGKNLIGTFTQPKAVFSDINFLATLPEPVFKEGLVETIKHALIADKDFFTKLFSTPLSSLQQAEFLQEMIYISCDIKRRVVETDEREENGQRQLLNFGHTIGHALETVSDYSITHGAAVAVGIAAESYLSHRLGLLTHEALVKILAVFAHHQISIKLSAARFNKTAIKDKLLLDKKARGSTPYFVLLTDIAKPHISNKGYSMPVEDKLIDEVLDWMLSC
jgi:3-dehydroquinate synthase